MQTSCTIEKSKNPCGILAIFWNSLLAGFGFLNCSQNTALSQAQIFEICVIYTCNLHNLPAQLGIFNVNFTKYSGKIRVCNTAVLGIFQKGKHAIRL